MMGSTNITHEVYLNGQLLDAVESFNWENTPQHSYQEFQDIGQVYDRRIKVTNYKKGNGTIGLISPINRYSIDPMELMDILGFRSSFANYNTTTEVVEKNSTVYDWDPDNSGSLDQPKVPHEIRQTKADAEIAIDSSDVDSSDYEAVAQVFRAHCTDLTTVKVKLRDVTGSDVSAIDVEIFDIDEGGNIDIQLSGSNTVNATGLTVTDGTGYGDATWVSIDISNIMGTASLTPGETYALVIKAAETDVLYLNTCNSESYTPGAMYYSSDGGSSWVSGTADAGTDYDLAFILQGIDSYGGHNLIIYDYTQGETSYVKHTCYGCHVMLENVAIEQQKHITANLKFRSEKIETTKG